MTVKTLDQYVIGRLTPAVGSREAISMSRLIAEDVMGVSRIDMAINPGRDVEPETEVKVRKIVERVVKGEPLQYVLGFADFHGLRLRVTKDVLIPRPETSELVDNILDKTAKMTDLEILDVCTGSGAIAVALGRALPFPRITAVDISEAALMVARHNIEDMGLKNIITLRTDVLTDGLPSGHFDIVVSNPPYVDDSEKAFMDRRVLDHEPHIALFVPDDNPLLFYTKIATDAKNALKNGGSLYFEINPRHAEEMKALLDNLGYHDIDIIRDSSGKLRFATARK